MSNPPRRVVRPSGGDWKFADEEDALRQGARDVPNWRLANASRKMLADLTHQLAGQMPSLGEPLIADLDPDTARQIATLQLAGLAVRSSSAALSLVAVGYEPEGALPLRKLIEAVLRARAVTEDASGEHARQWLSNRPLGKIERLAQRFGDSEDLRLLSALSHANVRALLPAAAPPGWNAEHPDEGAFNVRPTRDFERASGILYAVGYETSAMVGPLAEAFEVGVQMPHWLSSELIRLRDERQRRAEAG